MDLEAQQKEQIIINNFKLAHANTSHSTDVLDTLKQAERWVSFLPLLVSCYVCVFYFSFFSAMNKCDSWALKEMRQCRQCVRKHLTRERDYKARGNSNRNYLDRRDDNSVHLVLHVFWTKRKKKLSEQAQNNMHQQKHHHNFFSVLFLFLLHHLFGFYFGPAPNSIAPGRARETCLRNSI